MKKRNEYGHWTLEFKEQVCEAYLKSNRTKVSIWREYTGHRNEHGNLTKWLRQLGYTKPSKGRKLIVMDNQKHLTDEELDKMRLLEKRLSELEKKVKEAEMKALAYSTMIDIAEETFKIPIRKKFDSKPSKK